MGMFSIGSPWNPPRKGPISLLRWTQKEGALLFPVLGKSLPLREVGTYGQGTDRVLWSETVLHASLDSHGGDERVALCASPPCGQYHQPVIRSPAGGLSHPPDGTEPTQRTVMAKDRRCMSLGCL